MKLSLLQSYLLAERLVDRDDLQRVEAERVARGLTLPSALLALQILNAKELAGFLARRFKLSRVEAAALNAAPAAHELDPTFALERRVLPVAREGDMLTLVMSDPTDSETAEEVERRTHATVLRAVALEPSLDYALTRHYGGGALHADATGELRELFGAGMNVVTQPVAPAEQAPIPLTQRKASPPPQPLASPSTDLENLVTAPLPRIDFTPGQEPPMEFQEPPPLPDLDDPPPLPPDALRGPDTEARAPIDAGAPSARGGKRRSSQAKKTQPLPALGTSEVVDEFEVSREIPATSRVLDARDSPKVDPRLPATLVDKLPEQTSSPAQKWALDWLAQLARRALLFRVEGTQLRAWAAAGLGSAASTLELTIDEQSLFAQVLRQGEIYVGPLPFGPTERRFATLVGRHPRELLLAPICDAHGPVGLVYCDDLHAAVRPRAFEGFAKRLAEHLRGAPPPP